MEPGGPPHLGIPNAVRREIVDELGRRPLESVGGLEERDRKVEEAEQLGLVAAPDGADHARSRLVDRERHPDRRRQLDGGLGAQRTVEVLVQLRLRQPAEPIGIHARMIRRRAILIGPVAAILIVLVCNVDGPGPEASIGADRLVAERAAAADDALDALAQRLRQAVDAAGIVHVLASHLPAAAASNADFTAARESAVLVHYWRDKASKVWHQTYTPFLERSSRGDIGVDGADNLYVASGDSSRNAAMTAPPILTPWRMTRSAPCPCV